MPYSNRVQDRNSIVDPDRIPYRLFYISNPPAHPSSLIYQLNRAGTLQQFPAHFLIRRDEAYPYTAMMCVTKGMGTVRIGGETVHMKAGRILLLPPYTPYEYHSDPQDPFSIVWAEFCGGDSERLVNHILAKNGYAFEGKFVPGLTDLCRQMIHPPKSGREIWIGRTLYEILLQLYQACSRSGSEQSTRIYEILDYLDQNLDQSLTLDQVSSAFGYNSSYFSKYFYQNTGVHFSRYLVQHRVARSKQLLLTTNLSLEQIAQQVGFYDASYFIRKFREIEETSPFKFRKQHTFRQILDHGEPASGKKQEKAPVRE